MALAGTVPVLVSVDVASVQNVDYVQSPSTFFFYNEPQVASIFPALGGVVSPHRRRVSRQQLTRGGGHARTHRRAAQW